MRSDYPAKLSRALFAAALLMVATITARADEAAPVEFALPQVSVEFKVDVLGVIPVTGRFHDVRGRLSRSSSGPEARIDITVCAHSLDTRNPERDDLLRSPQFFNVERFPAIRFSNVHVLVSQSGARQLAGELTMNGVRQPVVFQVTETQRETRYGTPASKPHTAQATISRRDFGLDAFPVVVGDDVEITVAVDGGLAELRDHFRKVSSAEHRLSARR